MEYFVLPIAVLTVGVIALFVKSKSRYYSRIYSDEHYSEVCNWLVSVLSLGAVSELSSTDDTTLRSSAGCGFTFTRRIDELDTIHIAISQIGNITTHAVSNQFACLIVRLLDQNKAEADFFWTDSGVHHVVLAKESAGDWITNPVGIVVPSMKSSQHIPFRYQSLQ